MWNEALDIAITNGIFAVLFVSLLLYQLKDSASREKKYIATIEKLNNHLTIIEDIKEDIEDIKRSITPKRKPSKKSNIESGKISEDKNKEVSI